MNRRRVLQAGMGLALASKTITAYEQRDMDAVASTLLDATASGQVAAAALYVEQGGAVFARAFGAAKDEDAIFLLASISKPMVVAAIMTLIEKGLFDLEDPVKRFLPEFTGEGRDRTTIRHLFTHLSGLPDQLPENERLRARHAELDEFVERAIRTPLVFQPGSKYGYSSMGILLASEVARRISGKSISVLVDETVFQPLGMTRSALGLGRLTPETLMRCQVEHAAPESGAGDTTAESWDWNSDYWRRLGAPWGGVHGSAIDVARFLVAFLRPQGKLLRPDLARNMVKNHNPAGVRPRGLGFDLGSELCGPRSSRSVFGHEGSTGTVCWADPESDSICVVLTTLPAHAADPHPRDVAARHAANAVSK